MGNKNKPCIHSQEKKRGCKKSLFLKIFLCVLPECLSSSQTGSTLQAFCRGRRRKEEEEKGRVRGLRGRGGGVKKVNDGKPEREQRKDRHFKSGKGREKRCGTEREKV